MPAPSPSPPLPSVLKSMRRNWPVPTRTTIAKANSNSQFFDKFIAMYLKRGPVARRVKRYNFKPGACLQKWILFARRLIWGEGQGRTRRRGGGVGGEYRERKRKKNFKHFGKETKTPGQPVSGCPLENQANWFFKSGWPN